MKRALQSNVTRSKKMIEVNMVEREAPEEEFYGPGARFTQRKLCFILFHLWDWVTQILNLKL